MSQTQLCEQYRPRSFEEVVGQDKVISKIRLLAKRGLAGRGYWISGQSGTGKTTLLTLRKAMPFSRRRYGGECSGRRAVGR